MTAESRETLRRFFSGLSEHTFHTQLGVVDPALVDYIADLLVRFVRSDAVYRVRSLTGQPLMQLAMMIAEAEQRVGDAKRDVHRHIGDFALFWTGVYPEALQCQDSKRSDRLVDYFRQGKRAYRIASEMPQAGSQDRVLSRLSEDFEMCAFGLREVRREWERRDSGDAPAIMWN